MIGPGCPDVKLKILKRTVTYDPSTGYLWDPDPKHRDSLLEMLHLQDAKPAPTPGSKDTAKNLTDAEDSLEYADSKLFQSAAGTLLYHSADDPRVQYETNVVMSDMAKPTKLGQHRLVRVVRYLKGAGMVRWQFRFQKPPIRLYGLCDSDQAGDTVRRRSVSCMHVFGGSSLVETESWRHAVIALSSGESEFYAIGGCGAMLMMIENITKESEWTELFEEGPPSVFSDSSAGRACPLGVVSARLDTSKFDMCGCRRQSA